MKKKDSAYCSFCLRPKEDVRILIAGQEGHICENCVAQAQQMVDEELMQPVKRYKFALTNSMKPRSIKEFLDT